MTSPGFSVITSLMAAISIATSKIMPFVVVDDVHSRSPVAFPDNATNCQKIGLLPLKRRGSQENMTIPIFGRECAL
ncbi:hypothetical protein [Burkholderia multivorans]|uniref:hypothetical protein n=1 Tax=Burkholderia multivorans TaxID=87883 RepID=UPI0020B452DA|nr:hypothetical protein [Burkholderia multivorans]